MNEQEKKHKALLDEWYNARPEYEVVNEFTWDGPGDWETWSDESNKPKILFLVKEAPSGWHAKKDEKIDDRFTENIGKWRSIIKFLYLQNKNKSKTTFEEYEESVGVLLNDIARVEVKKEDAEQPTSNEKEIIQYAIKDADFLRRQIDIINPDIVFCGNTLKAYSDNIYKDDDDWSELTSIEFENGKYKLKCYKHYNRLIIDFYHPSAWISGLNEQLYELLLNGKIFEKFTW